MTQEKFDRLVIEAMSRGELPMFPDLTDLDYITWNVLHRIDEWVSDINSELSKQTEGKISLVISSADFRLEVIGPVAYLHLRNEQHVSRLFFLPGNNNPFKRDPDILHIS